ncbi:VanZ family protein [Limnoglobus roseus]|uniref:VanZ family protein n=1 Tax=Limnoglobus roseus TaxID=2598579 RepID=A0A5C1A6K2_9BACT|nr:VanZ family protein [Limnoglobus roseus]QEL14370.1 VanZ family protein [Limnoglobus roseus]
MRIFFPLVFVALLLVWSWLLVKPEPVPESLLGDGFGFDRETLHFVLAKSLHLSVYAFFAVFGGLLPDSARGRRWVWGGLVLHGILSEIAQMIGAAHFDTQRHGCVRDMLIDAAGIAVGAGVVLHPRISALRLGRLRPRERARHEVLELPPPE